MERRNKVTIEWTTLYFESQFDKDWIKNDEILNYYCVIWKFSNNKQLIKQHKIIIVENRDSRLGQNY